MIRRALGSHFSCKLQRCELESGSAGEEFSDDEERFTAMLSTCSRGISQAQVVARNALSPDEWWPQFAGQQQMRV
jgi:hypothetical protein